MILSMKPDLLIRRPKDEGRAGSQNEEWDDFSLHQVGAAAAAVLPSSRVEALHHTAVPAEAASSLDDFLNTYPSALGFILSIPISNEHEHKLSLPADMPSENAQKNEEEGSCAESTVSDLTEMTYRAELMKQVSSERSHVFALIRGTAANFFSFYRHRHLYEGNQHRV